MDWVSFGYGAGMLAAAWTAGDCSDAIYHRLWVWRHHWRLRQAERRMHRLAVLAKIRELEKQLTLLEGNTKALLQLLDARTAQVEALEVEKAQLSEAHQQVLAADEKWAAYKERSALNRAVASTVRVYEAGKAKAGVPVGPGAASAPARRVKLVEVPRQPQRLDGLGWAGKPGTVCGRGMCCLSENHDGDCTV